MSDVESNKQVIRVSGLNTGVLSVAVDWSGDSIEVPCGDGDRHWETVKIGRTYVEGTAVALRAFALWADEQAEDSIRTHADMWECNDSFRETSVQRSLRATKRAVAKILSALPQEVKS